jgi:hypothetical protein
MGMKRDLLRKLNCFSKCEKRLLLKWLHNFVQIHSNFLKSIFSLMYPLITFYTVQKMCMKFYVKETNKSKKATP